MKTAKKIITKFPISAYLIASYPLRPVVVIVCAAEPINQIVGESIQ